MIRVVGVEPGDLAEIELCGSILLSPPHFPRLASLVMSGSNELEMTPEEIQRFSECLKQEEFRKMFAEYAKEISDPENRARREGTSPDAALRGVSGAVFAVLADGRAIRDGKCVVRSAITLGVGRRGANEAPRASYRRSAEPAARRRPGGIPRRDFRDFRPQRTALTL